MEHGFYPTNLDGEGLRIGIVQARFNEPVCEALRELHPRAPSAQLVEPSRKHWNPKCFQSYPSEKRFQWTPSTFAAYRCNVVVTLLRYPKGASLVTTAPSPGSSWNPLENR